ncbi:glycine-rich protein DOT1-like [Miscanthus floridulus]|uniref:glycine-rich protein DOT1-like n=1 Tax=Miscanthus floridulus TaxID=154761 RepID=UPI003459E790
MVVGISFSPPLFSLPLLLSSSKCSLHGQQGRTGPAGGRAGPVGDALAARVGHRRAWTGARGADRGCAGRGGGPPAGVAGGAQGRPGTHWPPGGPPAGVAGGARGRPGTVEVGDNVALTTTRAGLLLRRRGDGAGAGYGGAGMGRGPPLVARGRCGGRLRRRGDGAGAGERLRQWREEGMRGASNIGIE